MKFPFPLLRPARCLLVFLLVSAFGLRPAPAAAAEPAVRVLVSENQKLMRLTVKGEYTVRALPSLKVLKKGKKISGVPITQTPRGIKLGSEEFLTRGIRIEPRQDRDLYLDQSRFRGTMGVWKDPVTQSLYAVNTLGMEGYLYGVLHHEVAPWWPMEALKAQAVAARTYAFYQIRVSRVREYDVKSTTSSQVYGGSTTERFRSKRAVDATRGLVLSFEGRIFPAYFHATCAGMTAAASELWKIDLPPLRGGVSCGYCRISPHYEWEARVPLADVEEKVRKYSPAGAAAGLPGRILKIELISRTPSGRVGSLKVTGTAGDVVVAAKDFRIWVGGDKIRSTNFTVSVQEDAVIFKGKGWGHGVGLCQWGTLGQALLGHSHEKILQFYYPGSKIELWTESQKE